MGQARSIFRAPVVAWRGLGCADASPHPISELLSKSLNELSPLALPSSWRHKTARHGRWYMASSESHVEYGSTDERDRLMWLEFQIAPVAICHSPVMVLPARDLDEAPVTAALGYEDPTETLSLTEVSANRHVSRPFQLRPRLRDWAASRRNTSYRDQARALSRSPNGRIKDWAVGPSHSPGASAPTPSKRRPAQNRSVRTATE